MVTHHAIDGRPGIHYLPLALAAIASLSACGGSRSVPPAPAAPAPAPAQPNKPPTAGPPLAPVRPVSDDYFGTQVVDPYRWMETPESPELVSWMKAQDVYTRAFLARIPQRDALRARIGELDKTVDTVSGVRRYGKWIFYLKRPAGSELAKLYVREGMNGPERLLFDPQQEKEGEAHVSVNAAVPSRDGRYVALGTSPAGSEDGIVRVLETATGKFTGDRIDRINFAAGGVGEWLDHRHLGVLRLQKLPPGAPQTERYNNIRQYLHTVGNDPEGDPVLSGRGVNPAIPVEADSDRVFVTTIPTLPHLFAIVGRGTDKHIALYVAPLSRLGPGDAIPWRKLVDFQDRVVDFAVHRGDLYLLTHKDAPRYQLVRTRLSKPDPAHAEAVIPEGELVLRGLAAAKDALYVSATERGLGRLLRLRWDGKGAQNRPVPIEGSLSLHFADVRQEGVLFEQQSWLRPRAIFAYRPGDKTARDTGLQPAAQVDVSAFTSIEVEAPSADGTAVPLSIVVRKDAPRDGSNLTFLDAYGGYGNSYDPFFDPRFIAAFEHGTFAVCHVRGGSELGDDWHEQGRLANKHHTWEDFIGCGEYLVANKYTSPGKLVGSGTSMGGICIGNVVVRRPDLLAAAIIRVGVSNPLRMEASSNIFQVPEIGTVTTKEGFDMLLAMDPYLQVKDGVRYPPVLLTTGLTDPRVVPWQVTKMAARLQQATASGKPVLLRVEQQGGHGLGSTASQFNEEFADDIAFGLAQTGSP